MSPQKKLTREERLQKRRAAERLRYQEIKNDPDKYELQKQKEKEKCLKKKEKGIIKTVEHMTPREHRKAKKIWKKKARERRQRQTLQNTTNVPVTPSISDVDHQMLQNNFRRRVAAKVKSDRARRQRYLINKKKDETINKLKTKLARYKKRLQRLRKHEKLTPNSKVDQIMNSPSARNTVKKNLLLENSFTNEQISTLKSVKHQAEDEEQPSTSKKTFRNGDFILVKLLSKTTEYRYVAMCTGLEEDGEIQVVFCKIADNTGKLFKVDEQDNSFISEDQVVQTLPMPNLILKGQRMFYLFNKSVNVFEKA